MKHDLKNITIYKNNTIIQALNQLNKLNNISRLILFVIDKNELVIGSLTDGDIRRAIVNNSSLQEKVSNVCNYDFCHEFNSSEFIDYSIYSKKNIKILPILNKQKKLIDVIDLTIHTAKLPLECFLLAGGRGKRLSPLTDKIPKPMLLIDDKPIIEHNIDRLIGYGIKKFYISVNYKADLIMNYFKNGTHKGIEIEYIIEENPLGTAGSIGLIKNFGMDNVLVMNSDLLTDLDFKSMFMKHQINKSDITIASTKYKVDIPFAILENKNNLICKISEKPSFFYDSNAGIYIIKKTILNNIKENEYLDMPDFIKTNIEIKRKVMNKNIDGFWIDIGTKADYESANKSFKNINKYD